MMNLLTILLLPAAISCRAIGPQKRQIEGLGGLLSSLGGGGGLLDAFMPNMKPVMVTDLEPKVRKEAKRQQLVWGPFDFKPSSNTSTQNMAMSMGIQMDPQGQIIMSRLAGFCNDCNVLHGATYIAHADGSRVSVSDGAYLHHLLILNPNKRLTAYYQCSVNGAAQNTPMPSSYFLGSGEDESEYYFTTPDGQYNSGYYIAPNDGFMMQSEIVNYSPEPQRWYIAADYEYEPGRPEGTEDVSVTDFNVNNCLGFLQAGYRPPNNEAQFNKTSPSFVLNQDGTILHAMGHIHDGGKNILLKVNNQTVCDARATYGGPQGTFSDEQGKKWETISSMTPCRDAVPVKKGDVMSMTAVYDTDAHPLRHSTDGEMMEQMGIYTILFAAKSSPPTAPTKSNAGL